MNDEFTPNWDAEAVDDPACGSYVWPVTIWQAELPPANTGKKPYIKLFYIVNGGQFDQFKNSFRIYINPEAKVWALWFLKKFNYPEELLTGKQPVIRRTAFNGLTGKILVEVFEDPQYGKKFEVKGFSRLDELDLEKKVAPPEETIEPSIDINADAEEADLSFLDEPVPAQEEPPFVATDEDIPF